MAVFGMKLLSAVVVINGRDTERNFGCSQVIRCPESKGDRLLVPTERREDLPRVYGDLSVRDCRAGRSAASLGAVMTRRIVHGRPGEILHNRGAAGLIGAWNESTPLVLSRNFISI